MTNNPKITSRMKKIFIPILFLFLTITAFSQSGQMTRAQSLSLYVRMTNVIPMLDPQPCSSYLLPFGATEAEIKSAAKREGLKLFKRESLDNGSYIIYYIDPDTKHIIYGFSFARDKSYAGIVIQSFFKDEAIAKDQQDRLLRNMISRWSLNLEENSASSICTNDGLGRFMLIDLKGDLLTIAITYTR